MKNTKLEIKEQKEDLYTKEGQLGGAVGAVVALITGIGVAVLVMIFVGTLGGQTYQLAEADINEITNETIRNHVRDGIVESFNALEQTGSYLPLIVLAVIISLVLALVLGFAGAGGGFGGRGSAL